VLWFCWFCLTNAYRQRLKSWEWMNIWFVPSGLMVVNWQCFVICRTHCLLSGDYDTDIMGLIIYAIVHFCISWGILHNIARDSKTCKAASFASRKQIWHEINNKTDNDLWPFDIERFREGRNILRDGRTELGQILQRQASHRWCSSWF